MFYSAFVLNASMPVDEALARARLHGPRTRVVVRRQVGYQLFFYPFTVQDLMQRLSSVDGGISLQDALFLHEYDAVATVAAAAIAERTASLSVVLEGEHVVGVYDEPQALAAPRRAPRATRRSGSARAAPPPRPPSRPRSARSAPRAHGRTRASPDPRRFANIDYELGLGEGSEPGGVASPVAERPPERLEAFPLVHAPDAVAPGDRFDVTIGLSETPVAEVLGSRMAVTVPPGSTTVDFTVLVAAEGFDAPEGWRRTLTVPVAQPDAARVTVPLVALPTQEPRLSFLLVHFSSNGEACGMASRKIIVRDPALEEPVAIQGGRPWLGERARAAAITYDPRRTPPDLTIRLAKPDGDDTTGRFACSFESPHPLTVPAPEVFRIDLGRDAQSFAKALIDEVSQNEGKPLIDLSLRGVAKTVRDKLPAVFWDVLRQVWDRVHGEHNRSPTLLLLSAEPHVPWELALVELDKARPPFLGAQVAMARWVLDDPVPLPPAREVVVREMAVVVGDYKSSRRLRPLPEAIAEGKALAKQYGAIPLTATQVEIEQLLRGTVTKQGATVGPDAIHFACHGEVDPTNPHSGRIYLDDASVLTPMPFRSAPVGESHGPFLFLNACQVAQAGELLNEYGGFAGNALRAGFRGFVAPLWSVDDRVAREIALGFYERAFGRAGGLPDGVASILRDIRGKFSAAGNAPPQATYLAYVFYGHPNLLLSRQA